MIDHPAAAQYADVARHIGGKTMDPQADKECTTDNPIGQRVEWVGRAIRDIGTVGFKA
jgi:hypothetical protein